MKNEILNIEWHTVRLTLRALNESNTVVEAGRKLGISERTIYRNMALYNITQSETTRQYTCPKMPEYEIRAVAGSKKSKNEVKY